MSCLALNYFLPSGVAEVGCTNNDVIANGVDQRSDAGIVLVGSDEALPLEILHGVVVEPLDPQPTGAALYPSFQTVQPEGGPAAAGFQEHQLQVRMAFQHPAHDEGSADQHAAHHERHCGAAVAQAGQVVQQTLVERMVGAGMQPDGQSEFGAGFPQHVAFRVEQP